ncbi:MAG TPA: hypothetical protein PKV67_03795 [Hyphomonas sp.]|nr:hypothetical protein [Hyphomonas sp.]HRI99873.1 hypothetical protein [Hyphomonas sp.]HRK67727.1 hypothetical protein [Hyphomonas sp.]
MTTMDEKLSAYLDNMLPEDERAALESLIAASPELAARLEALALANADFIGHAASIDAVPLSEGLQRQMDALRSAASGGGRSNITAFRKRSAPGRFFNDHRALAACAAIGAGFFAWQAVVPTSDLPSPGAIDSGGLIIAESPLGRMFAAAPSEAAVPLGEGEHGRVRFTFASADGGWCRLADVEASGVATRIVACESGGDWRMMMAAYAGPADRSGTDIYRTASTHAVINVEALLDTLMADAPLAPEEELAQINTGWRQSPTIP